MELAVRNTFRKGERLYKKSELENLVKGGRSFVVAPFRTVWLFKNESSPYSIKIAISAPKRRIRNASDRNRIKRLIRESFRQHKHALSDALKSENRTLHVLLIYNGNLNPLFTEVETKIILILHRLKKLHEQTSGASNDSDDHRL
ncbi:MAG: ribonuclease P protein component [Bacteroidetes bacterium]|jgi:ribonuclease P protein component|nr:ribonuclease P protein component [Bacteroidota bacterium]